MNYVLHPITILLPPTHDQHTFPAREPSSPETSQVDSIISLCLLILIFKYLTDTGLIQS
jgi:hypothetical protein